jgi:phosphatidylserine/phosphatidylglycerophosphate/cardiolipin synthase-like enzyme
LAGIDARAAFSPHAPANTLLHSVAADIDGTTSSLFFSLAFLYQTPGPVLDAIQRLSGRDDIFVYGVSDRKVNGLEVLKPDGTVGVVYPSALSKNVPPPFKKEPTGGGGVRLHHKFAVIDFDKPGARVYLGSYNFSSQADVKNGENLLLIRDRRVATTFMIEALRIVDHYHFRVKETDTRHSGDRLALAKPPRLPGEVAWWEKDFTNPRKILDRKLFA